MNLICWNCRGLGGPSAVREVKDLIRSYRPSVLALIETKVSVKRWNSLRVKLGFLNCFAVNRSGLSGGLAVLWHEGTEVHVQSFSRWHIDMRIGGEKCFRATVFYGNPIASKRNESWELMKALKGAENEAWTIMGDFNEIFFKEESLGCRQREVGRMRRFREVAFECGLADVGFSGSPYTFSNRRKGIKEVRVRLDRVLATSSWRELFPNVAVKHGSAYSSDHNPLVVLLNGVESRVSDRQFRFEAMWSSHPEYSGVVDEAWQAAERNAESLEDTLKGCAQSLTSWNKRVFGHVQTKIKMLKARLDNIRKRSRSEEMCRIERATMQDLEEWLWREEVMWQQRSRVQWLREGDSNSAFFHAKASGRRKTNTIEKLVDENGVSHQTKEGMALVAEQYFEHLFKSQTQQDEIDWDNALVGVDQRVTEEMNVALMAPVEEAEIKDAVFQMHPTKAPGLDGFPALFYQKHWALVRRQVCAQVSSILDGGSNPDTLNATKVILIPKRKGATEMKQFRPISLCNVVMRIVTKVITNRLKSVIPQIVSEAQSAFIPGRLISDNILLAHEVSHFIKSRRGNGKAFISLKLDMCKAYDKMEWGFLERMLGKLGFAEPWIEKVMRCIKSVTYVIKVNDKLTKSIKPARGLRQGDPLSPYLFILGSEWLSRTIERRVILKQIEGLRISRRSPSISHLLFADDSLLFGRADRGEVGVIKEVLEAYEILSGQQVNLEKSHFVCSPNTNAALRRDMEVILGMNSVDKHDKYLGLPMCVGLRKTTIFSEIEEKASGRVLSWKSNLLSMAGREVLVKSVLMAMPQYAMTCYKLPVSLCDRLQRMAVKFWWSAAKDSRSIHWVKRELLMDSKERGGMGFRDLRVLNDAFLVKQAWRLISHPNLLLSKVLKGRYFANNSLLEVGTGSNPSHAWRGICKVKHWLPFGMGNWDGVSEPEWQLDESGNFSIKSMYLFLMNQRRQGQSGYGEQSDSRFVRAFWRKVWKSNCPSRVKLTVWRFFHNALPDAANLRKRGCEVRRSCCVCGFETECPLHTVRDCWKAKAFWSRVHVEERWIEGVGGNAADWLFSVANGGDRDVFQKVMVGIWSLWNGRNAMLHEGNEWTISAMVAKFKATRFQCEAYLGRRLSIKIPDALLSMADRVGDCVFCDASWNPFVSGLGLAAVVLSNGNCRAVNASWLQLKVAGREAEGRALLLGMRLAAKLGIKQGVFVSDSIGVVQAIGLEWDDQSRGGGWLEECLRLRAQNPGWWVKHALREDNMLADAIARFALMAKITWEDPWSLPRCLRQFFI